MHGLHGSAQRGKRTIFPAAGTFPAAILCALFACPSRIAMSTNALYTDLSGYYDLMCADIDYQAQSHSARRLHQLFGNQGRQHLDLACGTGPHVRHFLDFGYHSSGLDLNQPMLDRAQLRCPEAQFSCQNMCDFRVDEPLDLITCFLYSLHYSGNTASLTASLACVHRALRDGGVFIFNAVDKDQIDNASFARHSVDYQGSHFTFQSGWHYRGTGAGGGLLARPGSGGEREPE